MCKSFRIFKSMLQLRKLFPMNYVNNTFAVSVRPSPAVCSVYWVPHVLSVIGMHMNLSIPARGEV